MKETVAMHKRESIEYLIKDLSNSGLCKVGVSLPDHLVQVLLHVLEYKIEGVVLPDHLFQLDNVGMRQLL